MKKALKISALLMAFVLVIAGTVGVTLALLTDKTDPIKNTFTIGKVEITLTETTGNSYKLVPGTTVNKDPKVTVLKDSEDCWLFVKVEQDDTLEDIITYDIAGAGWTALDGVAGVYYRSVARNETADQEFYILNGNVVTIASTVDSDDLSAITESSTLTFTAYAVQTDTTIANATDAWNAVKDL